MPETPSDPLAKYEALLAERAALDATDDYADPAIAEAFSFARNALDSEIAKTAGSLLDGAIEDVTSSLKALEQLGKLAGLSVAASLGDRLPTLQEGYRQRIGKAAAFLTRHAATDPRVALILEAAQAAGVAPAEEPEAAPAVEPVTTTPIAPAPAQTRTPRARGRVRGRAVVVDLTPPSQVAEEPAAEAPPISNERRVFSFEDAYARLGTFAAGLQTGLPRALKPNELWTIIAPGEQYVSHRHRHLIEQIMGGLGPDSEYSLSFNYARGRGALYNLKCKQRGTVPPLPNGELTSTLELPGEFDIDTFFSTDDALLLASFLYKFRDLLSAQGVEALDPEALSVLLQSVDTKEVETERDAETLLNARRFTIAKMGRLFQDQQLLDAAIDNLSTDDPRYLLFEHLVNIIDEETYPKLLGLLEAQKEHVIQMQLRRHGGQIIGIAGVVVMPNGAVLAEDGTVLTPAPGTQTHTQPTPTSPPPVTDTESTPAAEEVSGETDEAADVEEVGNADATEPARRSKSSKAQGELMDRCRQRIGEMLTEMGALDFTRDHKITTFRGFMGSQANRVVRTARERGLLDGQATGNTHGRHTLSIPEAVMARLAYTGDPALQSFIMRKRKEIREMIDRAVEARIAARTAASQPQA